jgi:hypothetical protein
MKDGENLPPGLAFKEGAYRAVCQETRDVRNKTVIESRCALNRSQLLHLVQLSFPAEPLMECRHVW